MLYHEHGNMIRATFQISSCVPFLSFNSYFSFVKSVTMLSFSLKLHAESFIELARANSTILTLLRIFTPINTLINNSKLISKEPTDHDIVQDKNNL